MTALPQRPVRSFVLREGRLTRAQERAFAELWPRFGVDWLAGEPLDLKRMFPGSGEIRLEIGFGNGESLAEMAAQSPQHQWLGIEVHRPGVGHLLLEIERRGLENLRILRHDAVEVLQTGLPAASLDRIQLFFPDPWPKRRHHKRRILTPAFVPVVARVLRGGGVFHAATDWEPYAEQMLEVLEGFPELFVNSAGPMAYADRPPNRPLTKFEQRGTRLGHPVRDLLFKRR